MKKMVVFLWALICLLPSVFPGYFLFFYKDPGGGNFGWEMFLGAIVFWGSVAVAIVFSIINAIIWRYKPTNLINKGIAGFILFLSLAPLIMAVAEILKRK